jgi:DNA polymerase
MPAVDRTITRQASALLARHLETLREAGTDRIWLRPGTSLKLTPTQARSTPVAASGSRQDALAALAGEAAVAPEPRALGTLRDIFVFGTGNPQARQVFIGEAPGQEEERLRQPFVGPAGELLNKSLTAMGLTRQEVYITNVVKYRPGTGDGEQGSANRKPNPREIAACLPILEKELAILQPEVLVALGGSALAALTGNPDARIGQERGKFLTFKNIPLMPTFHPSYLLRQQGEEATRREKRKFWEDLMLVMERLQMPISARQRGYFTK